MIVLLFADEGLGLFLSTFMSAIVCLYCFIFLAILGSSILWIVMLVDCLTRKDYQNPDDKLLWAIVILLTHALGGIIYYFMVKRKK